MRGVLLSLSKLDVNAESFVRIITYFDELVRNRASLDALVRATAALAECTAGLRDECNCVVVRYTENGDAPTSECAAILAEAPITLDGQCVGSVWLERDTGATQFDSMLTERMALAASGLWQHDLGRAVGAATEPALFDLALSARTGEVDRIRALNRLGFSETQPLQVVVVSADDIDDVRLCLRQVRARLEENENAHVRATLIGLKGAVIAQRCALIHSALERIAAELRCAGLRLGVGMTTLPAEADKSWESALGALRLSATWLGGSAVTQYVELGVLAVLADLPTSGIGRSSDVQALATLAHSPRGGRDLEALEALFRTGSLRQAAADMHLHHSSVAARLRHVEDALGLSLNDPIGHLRAQLAVALWRLLPARTGDDAPGRARPPAPRAGHPRSP